MKQPSPRYAVYYVPERDSLLERLGSPLLGRDIYTGGFLMRPGLGGVSPDEQFLLTHDAGRYGLHATLKPPFFLKPGVSEEKLIQAAERFTRERRPYPLPVLGVDRIGSFFALTMHPQTEAEMEDAEKARLMAREAVQFFDNFRAHPSDEELDRRRKKGLTSLQEKYLLMWGHPYVFDEFRFHITLMDAPQDPAPAVLLQTNLQRYMAPALEDNRMEAIFICRSDSEGDFTVLHRSGFRTGFYSSRVASRSAFA